MQFMTFRLSRFEVPLIEGSEVKGSFEDTLPDNEQFGEMTSRSESRFKKMISLITSSPYDTFLMINEHFESVDWDSKARVVAKPTGNILTALLFIARLLQDNLIKPNLRKIGKKHDGFDLSKSEVLRNLGNLSQVPTSRSSTQHLDWYWELLAYLNIALKTSVGLLVLVNLLITYKFLLSRYQTYSLFYCKARPKSTNVTKRSLNDLQYRYVEDISRSSLWSMINYTIFRKKVKEENHMKERYYYQLKKWAPGKFNAALFSSFSPICVAFLLVTDVSFKTALAVIVHQYFSFLVLFDRYEDRLDDEACLAKANFEEINEKIIKPKTSVKTQDAMVDATGYDGGSTVFFPSFTTTRSHLFQTHAVTGDVVRERYNSTTKTFEDIETEGAARNYVCQAQVEGQRRTPRCNNMQGASVRPQFFSRQPSPSKIGTPSHFLSRGNSSSSAPSTPVLRPLPASQNGQIALNSISGLNRGNSLNRDASYLSANNTLSRLKRNSVSPTKSGGYRSIAGLRAFYRPTINADSSISMSMDMPSNEIPFEEVARRGRRHLDGASNYREAPASRSSAVSSRHSSISPSKHHSSYRRRDSLESRPPFR